MSLKHLSLILLIWSGFVNAQPSESSDNIDLNPLRHLSRYKNLMTPIALNFANFAARSSFDTNLIKDPRIKNLFTEAKIEKLRSIISDSTHPSSVEQQLSILELLTEPSRKHGEALIKEGTFTFMHKALEDRKIRSKKLRERSKQILEDNPELVELKKEVDSLDSIDEQMRVKRLPTDENVRSKLHQKTEQFEKSLEALRSTDSLYQKILKDDPYASYKDELLKEEIALTKQLINEFKLEEQILDWYKNYIAALKADKSLVAFVAEFDKEIDKVLAK